MLVREILDALRLHGLRGHVGPLKLRQTAVQSREGVGHGDWKVTGVLITGQIRTDTTHYGNTYA